MGHSGQTDAAVANTVQPDVEAYKAHYRVNLRVLDEIIADFFAQTKRGMSDTTVREMRSWLQHQCKYPNTNYSIPNYR